MDTMLTNTICALAFGLAVAGCATPTTRAVGVDPKLAAAEAQKQREIALENLDRADERLARVAFPLLTANASLCGDKAQPVLGFMAINLPGYAKEFQPAAAHLWHMSSSLQVRYVPPGSPAHAAGLQTGDILLSIGGRPAPNGEGAVKEWSELVKTVLKVGEPVAITVRRGEIEKQVRATPVSACNFPVLAVTGDSVNAAANGTIVLVTLGMMRFVENDNEIALVLAHEGAHNAMKHIEARQRNSGLGSILDILAAARGINTRGAFGNLAAGSYSKEFEAEADYVGLYMMARAGLPIDSAPSFWRRMAAANPGSIGGGGYLASHPATPDRFVAMEQTVAEIKDKQARKLPLEPEYKKPAPAAEPEKTETGETP